MTYVRCCSCLEDVPEVKARRELTVWARTKKPGTLTGVKGIKATGRYRCDDCFTKQERKRIEDSGLFGRAG